MISATPQSPTLLEGFPLYWVPGVEFKKPRGLEVMAPYKRELCGLFLGAKYSSALLIKHEFDVLALKKYIDMTSGKERRKALLELARIQGAKMIGSSSSTTEPIAAPPLSVAPAEGPEPVRKRRRLAKAFLSSATAAAAAPTPSTEEESSGSPLVHYKRKLPEVGGASSLQPGEIDEGSASPRSAQPAPAPTSFPSPQQLPSPALRSPPPAPLPSPPPAGQALGQSTPPAGGDSAHSGGPPGLLALPPPPPPPTSTATAEGGGGSSRPSGSGASNENFSRVIALHRKQLILEKRIKELEHDKESLQSDFEAAQGSVDLMRGMVEKARGEYLAQVQETIKTEILMGQAVNSLDCEVVQLRSKVIHLEAETSSLRQLNSQLVGELESTRETAVTREKKLEEVVSKLSEAKGQLEEAASSIAALTTEKNATEASKQKLEAENADLMSVGAEALADGFELALEQIQCVLPDLDLSQFSIYHEVVDGKLIPPP
ncbi:uncharacterized protein [Phaseolus vulgaris]|uniref:uncharacterized protein n=1 Tax=Phaseolus vulgaris TaxID=3885 RepID=UPI0035CC985A